MHNLPLKALQEHPIIRFMCVGDGGFGTALDTFFKTGITLINFGSICFPSESKNTEYKNYLLLKKYSI